MAPSYGLRGPMRPHVVAAALALFYIGSLAIDVPLRGPMFSGAQFYDDFAWHSLLPKPWVQSITSVPATGWLLVALLFAGLFLANGHWLKGRARTIVFAMLIVLAAATFATAELAAHGVTEVFGQAFAEDHVS